MLPEKNANNETDRAKGDSYGSHVDSRAANARALQRTLVFEAGHTKVGQLGRHVFVQEDIFCKVK